ncbi:FdhF/YdeP family oxidoreductase [Nocardioides dongxiaopingii]|uniref:FdhF/YdeP family oxidoreductase n=1 Tax=Nocardioides sp. S-1144 TaxID=2582905 RepID=UPI00116549C1|nr:FdhF/YdeP family oxidoreductase [Nocardioides sp. S-1144]QDH11099.1 FdhF/YdeP family oxidoreductase [Nocardioides sp. S-1144]
MVRPFARKPPRDDIDESDLEVGGEAHAAAGKTAVAVALKRAVEQMGPSRTARTLLKLNQVDGFDCQGCAWPDPAAGHRHAAEFCENGAKAVTEEATRRCVDRGFFAEHPLAALEERTDYWLGQQGRITEPMVKRAGSTHYEPISWDDAFTLVAGHLRGLDSPDEAIFYTSGKTSNEAAFVYQLFVRAFGTNNLPDCSNMCHESTSVALAETIGIGKGSVSLEDVHDAELIVIAGQNPGTNHPRMLSALEIAKQRGARIIAVNPLREAGLVRFKNPQTPRGMVGPGTALADLFLPVRINGDLALFQGLAAYLLEHDAVDHDFVAAHTEGYEAWVEHLRQVDWSEIERATGLTRAQVEEAGEMLRTSSRTVFCWAMGLTQHRNSVATIKELVNLALAQGNIGKPGAGLCPVRGHSNVQGDRTMGIWERPKPEFLDALQAEFGFDPPREHGFDTVDSVKALTDGRARVFFAMGGNFASAVSDTEVTEAALRRADLTVHVSTKLNRSHVVTGREALILPVLGRSEKDLTGGREQRVTVEDSMSAVHASKGPLEPASEHLRSEVDIVCSLALATLGAAYEIPWADLRADYSAIRRRIANVVPGCAAYDEKVERPGGFVLPHPPRDSRTFPTAVGRAIFSVVPLDVLAVPEGRLLLQTMRSHDQFNTTIYGLDDRYRGVKNGRRVVFVNPDDIRHLGWEDGDLVDLVSEWDDGSERTAPAFRIVAYDQPIGCAAAYYPETNPLIPLDSKAEGSNTPTSKSVVVRLQAPGGGRAGVTRPAGVDVEHGHKRATDPIQQS